METTISHEKREFSLPIHSLVRTLQGENGLKHHDYARYRRFLTRKLRRVRKSLSLTYGKGKVFVKREVTPEIVTDSNYLLVQLLLAERAWCFAADRKDNLGKVNKNSLRHSSMRRFAKAKHHAERLESLCLAVADSHTTLEASAYASWMSGQHAVEQENWEEAVVQLSKAKSIYGELHKISDLRSQDLFAEKLSQVELSLRFALYNSGGDINADELAALSLAANPELLVKLEEIKAKRVVTQQEVKGATAFSWAGKPLLMPNEDFHNQVVQIVSLFDSLGSMNSTSEGSEATYVRCLSLIDEVSASLHKEAAELGASESGRVGEAKEIYERLGHFMEYRRQLCVLQHNQHLIQHIENSLEHADTRAAEVAHLYDQQLATIQNISKIPGLADDDVLALKYSVEEVVCRTKRAYSMSECYVLDKRWDEANTLLSLADALLNKVYNRVDDYKSIAEGDASVDELQHRIDALETCISGAKMRLPAAHFLASDASSSFEETSAVFQSLLQNKNKWIDAPEKSSPYGPITVQSIPPAFTPIPCKPVFFDVALNYMEFPDLDDTSKKSPAASPAGLVGAAQNFFGSWFGGQK